MILIQPIYKKDGANIFVKPHYQVWVITNQLDYVFAMSSHTSSCPDDIGQNQNWYIHQLENVSSIRSIRLLNNNWSNAKYRQMAFRSPSDGAPISLNQPFFGIPGQTKVSGDRQRETTHEICCLKVS